MPQRHPFITSTPLANHPIPLLIQMSNRRIQMEQFAEHPGLQSLIVSSHPCFLSHFSAVPGSGFFNKLLGDLGVEGTGRGASGFSLQRQAFSPKTGFSVRRCQRVVQGEHCLQQRIPDAFPRPQTVEKYWQHSFARSVPTSTNLRSSFGNKSRYRHGNQLEAIPTATLVFSIAEVCRMATPVAYVSAVYMSDHETELKA
jgi:hypothetical protein